MAKSSKVTFKQVKFATIVKAAEPVTPRQVAYEWSNGKKFYRKGKLG